MPRINKNLSRWKIPGTYNETCDKPCYFDICKRHRKLIRDGCRFPTLCRACEEIVTHSESYLCKKCKGNYIQQKMVRKEKKQQKLKEELLQEILRKVKKKM